MIANISLSVPDDLCVIESHGNQRLIAASVCSPSYWDLTKKIGKSLRDIHKPVKTLNKKLTFRNKLLLVTVLGCLFLYPFKKAKDF